MSVEGFNLQRKHRKHIVNKDIIIISSDTNIINDNSLESYIKSVNKSLGRYKGTYYFVSNDGIFCEIKDR